MAGHFSKLDTKGFKCCLFQAKLWNKKFVSQGQKKGKGINKAKTKILQKLKTCISICSDKVTLGAK